MDKKFFLKDRIESAKRHIKYNQREIDSAQKRIAYLNEDIEEIQAAIREAQKELDQLDRAAFEEKTGVRLGGILNLTKDE